MIHKLSITKDEINELPLFHFEGKVVLIDSRSKALDVIDSLKSEKILGFDTETKAAFKKGERYDVSLLQLATDTHAYLFRLNKFPLLKELTAILEDPNIVKAGVAINDDLKALKKLTPFEEKNFVDLAKVAQDRQIINFSLRALTAIFLRARLSKKAKISNWQREVLTPAQLKYAANDGVVGYLIYKALVK